MGMKTNFNVRHNQPFLKKSERKQIHQFLLPNKAFSFFQQGFFPPVQKLVSGDKAVGFLPGRQRKLALSLFFFFFPHCLFFKLLIPTANCFCTERPSLGDQSPQEF